MSCLLHCCRSLCQSPGNWKRIGPASAPTTLYGCAPGCTGSLPSVRASAYTRAGTAHRTLTATWRMATLVLTSSRCAISVTSKSSQCPKSSQCSNSSQCSKSCVSSSTPAATVPCKAVSVAALVNEQPVCYGCKVLLLSPTHNTLICRLAEVPASHCCVAALHDRRIAVAKSCDSRVIALDENLAAPKHIRSICSDLPCKAVSAAVGSPTTRHGAMCH